MEKELSKQIMAARDLVRLVQYSSRDLIAIATLTSSLHVDGHRADLVILKAARAQAAFEGRKAINDMDIALAAELALPHRIKKGPFHQAEVTMEELAERIQDIQDKMVGQGEGEEDSGPTDEGEQTEQNEKKK
jgi:Mg-chelatase subunit ChlI